MQVWTSTQARRSMRARASTQPLQSTPDRELKQ
jgi:hypothetical protein